MLNLKKVEKARQAMLLGTAFTLVVSMPLLAQAGGGYDSRYDRTSDDRFYTDEYGDVDTMWEEYDYRGDFDFRSADDRQVREFPSRNDRFYTDEYGDVDTMWEERDYRGDFDFRSRGDRQAREFPSGNDRFYTDEYGDVDTMWEERNYRGDFDFRSGDDRWNRDYPASERYRSRGHYRDPESYFDDQPYVSPDTYREDYRETGYRRDERFRDFRDSQRSDANLRENIRQELKESPYLDANRIEVQARNGVVTLIGSVEDWDSLVAAEENAYEGGARKVVNNLRIQRADDRPWADMGDNELRDEIESELTWSPFVDADKIQVRVRDGVAILQGNVENRSEMAAAVENAYEAGARRVVNQMRTMRD